MILVQSIGVVAVTISLFIFQLNQREAMLRLGIVAGVLYALHFFLLGAPTGAAMNLVGSARSFAFYKIKSGRGSLWVLVAFTFIALAGAVLTWQGPVSLLPMLGTMTGSFALWHKKPKFIRRWALFAPPLWFTYNAISGSYPGMLIEVVMLCSIILGEYRYDHRHKHHARIRFAHPR